MPGLNKHSADRIQGASSRGAPSPRPASQSLAVLTSAPAPAASPQVMLAWLRLSAPLRSLSALLLALAAAALLLPSLAGVAALSGAVGWALVFSAMLGLMQFGCALGVQFGTDVAGALFREAIQAHDAVDDVALSVDLMLAEVGGTPEPLPLLVAPWPRLKRWLSWQMACTGLQALCLVMALVLVAGGA